MYLELALNIDVGFPYKSTLSQWVTKTNINIENSCRDGTFKEKKDQIRFLGQKLCLGVF